MGDRVGQFGDISTALVLASPLSADADAACVDHLTVDEGSLDRVLNVLFTRRPEQRVENWTHHAGELPGTFVVLSSQRPTEVPDGVEVELLDSPGDLTDIGVSITDHLSGWSPEERTAFCLHSLTAQLQYVDRQQAYQFLHTLRDHLSERGVVGHVHMNPAAHDEETVDTFKTLFDAVVEVDDDGTTVTSRR